MLVVGAMGLAGCYSWRADVTRTASVQHVCPIANIQVVHADDYVSPRTVELRVCRERLVYQNAGHVWVDQTPVTPTAPAVANRPEQASPSAPAPESIFARHIRSRVDAARSNILTCTGGPTAVIAEWNVGQVRLSVRGETDVAVAQCVASAIGTIDVPAGTLPGRLIHPIAP